jgi:hypothetical protein
MKDGMEARRFFKASPGKDSGCRAFHAELVLWLMRGMAAQAFCGRRTA